MTDSAQPEGRHERITITPDIEGDADRIVDSLKDMLGHPAAQPPAVTRPGTARDLTMAEMLDTLRWIIDKDGAIPAKGSDREQRFIDLWTRRLRLPGEARRDSAGLTVERYREFLQIVARIETRWVRTGDEELRRAVTDLHDWHRRLSGSEGDGE